MSALKALFIALFALFVWASGLGIAAAQTPTPAVDPSARAAYQTISSSVSAARIADTVRTLSSFGSRLPGYPGHDKARDYLVGQLRSILGAQNVKLENFAATVPWDDGSSRIASAGKSYQIFPLWPNSARTSTVSLAGVTGPLIYGGAGELTALNGKQVMGSVVLMDFNCGARWLNAARLGAKAIVFIEPDLAMRGEAEAKFLTVPSNVPRFWIARRDAATLQAEALTTPDASATVTCNNPWKTAQASNIIATLPGSDPAMSPQKIMIESYYDSMSIVPALAPGAEQSTGAAAVLEMARIFKANPPKRTVMFVLTDAHCLGLLGMRTHIDSHVDGWQKISGWDHFSHSAFHTPLPQRDQVWLTTCIDLSSQSAMVGGFFKGNFYDFREDIQNQFADIGRALNDNAGRIGAALGFDPAVRYADAINPLGGKTWRNFLPGNFALDGEVAVLAGGKAVTFATCDDARQMVDTPADTFLHVNVANILHQVQLLACEEWDMLNDTNDPNSLPVGSAQGVMPVATYPAWERQGLQLGFARIHGRALLFDPHKSFVPSTPVTNSLIIMETLDKTFCGVRGDMLQQVGPDAQYAFVGMPVVTSKAQSHLTGLYQNQTDIEAFHVDGSNGPNRGNIDYAPDMGANGAMNYPIGFLINGTDQAAQIVEFHCVSTSIFDLIDQSNLESLNTMSVLDAVTNSAPRQYGYDVSVVDPASSYVEDVATVYSVPNTRIKLLMNTSNSVISFLLLNSPSADTKDNALGLGYDIANPNNPVNPPGFLVDGLVTYTPLRVASDMWNLDEFRIRQLGKYRIVDDEMSLLHGLAKLRMDQAQAALARKDYATFDDLIRQAWGYEARVYPRAQQTANDVVVGVLFYLFLLIPFAFFMERLLFSFPDLKRQIAGVFAIFIIIFLAFSQIHPAFDITANPSIVLIAFVMLALSLLVMGLVYSRFEEQMKTLAVATSGVHKVDVGKGSVAMAAFSLGISNMRRRRARTALTCITLILLTFTVLSFTSVVSTIRYNQNDAPGTPLYNGILLRDPTWNPLQDPAYRLLSDQYGSKYTIAPRAWHYGAAEGEQTFLTIRRADLSANVKGVCGFSPQESQVTHPQNLLKVGRWFQPGDGYVTILPDTIATNLGIKPTDVGRATITYSGQDFLVIGIIDGARLNTMRDLDFEQITPVDFVSTIRTGSPRGFTRYDHLDAETVLFVPYITLINLGGSLQSVAINFGSGTTTRTELEALMPRLDLNLYAGIDGQDYRFSAIGATAGKGLGNVLIPILIAALIVLNTMLSSVFERTREIAIFSSVGLSPGNVAMLFIAESLVYAVIGAVAGYLLGQAVVKFLSITHLLTGLSLNFSSTSAVISTVIVVAVVLLSTIYPARKASIVATPSSERTWKLPEPGGDTWTIVLPFAITGNQARGVNQYLAEWFRGYEEQSVGDFLTQGIETEPCTFEHGEGQRLTGRVWLAPFDLGVSQDITLDTMPTDLEDVHEVYMTLDRISGDVSDWKRVNRRFLNIVRQQFLIWRTLSDEQRERYMLEEEIAVAQDAAAADGASGRMVASGAERAPSAVA